MNKLTRVFFFTFLIALWVQTAFSQTQTVHRIAIVSQVDTAVTHVFVDPWGRAIIPVPGLFDYGAYNVQKLSELLEREHFEIVRLETPVWFNPKNYINFIGKPSRQFKSWLTSVKQQQDVDYFIVILHKWNPDPELKYKFLDGVQYGIASYSTDPHMITIFSGVGYYIFSTQKLSEVKLNSNHDRYVITNVTVPEGLPFNEIRSLPDKYYRLCKDKLRNIIETRDAEIRRVMIREIRK